MKISSLNRLRVISLFLWIGTSCFCFAESKLEKLLSSKAPKWAKFTYGNISDFKLVDSYQDYERNSSQGVEFTSNGFRLENKPENATSSDGQRVEVVFLTATHENGVLSGTCKVKENMYWNNYGGLGVHLAKSQGTWTLRGTELKLTYSSIGGTTQWFGPKHGPTSGRTHRKSVAPGQFQTEIVLTPTSKHISVIRVTKTAYASVDQQGNTTTEMVIEIEEAFSGKRKKRVL